MFTKYKGAVPVEDNRKWVWIMIVMSGVGEVLLQILEDEVVAGKEELTFRRLTILDQVMTKAGASLRPKKWPMMAAGVCGEEGTILRSAMPITIKPTDQMLRLCRSLWSGVIEATSRVLDGNNKIRRV